MRCIKCELENRAGRKFCASCGTALPVPCENCGFPNEAAERYCGGCGHSLVGERIGAVEAERNVDPEGDRRPVTVLFCDLVGYTHLSSVLDAEDVHALLERFFALVDATVDRFGGTIDKHIGDAAMALFGAPLARGNDAERAVRAALEIQTSFRSSRPACLPHWPFISVSRPVKSLRVRWEANTIAAIPSLAKPPTLPRGYWRKPSAEKRWFPTRSIRRPIMSSYEPLGPLVLKGVGHPVEAWRLTGTRSSAPDAHALVGRRSELGQFRAVLDACVNGAAGTALLIRGEPGSARRG